MTSEHAETFARLHVPGQPLLLANCWDAGSARLIESCGAAAMATTSAGLAWSRGYPDGDALPPSVLATAVSEITRVLSVPLSVDAEGGYSDDPKVVGENVRAIVDAGGVGINIRTTRSRPTCSSRRSRRPVRRARRPASISSSTPGPTSTCAVSCRSSAPSRSRSPARAVTVMPAPTGSSCRP